MWPFIKSDGGDGACAAGLKTKESPCWLEFARLRLSLDWARAMPTVKRLVAKAASNRVVSVSFRIPCIASVGLLGTTRGAWMGQPPKMLDWPGEGGDDTNRLESEHGRFESGEVRGQL